MSDADIDAKFRKLARAVLPNARVETLLGLCRSVESLTDAAEIARAAVG